MKRSLLCAMALAALCLMLVPERAQAQYAYGVSDIASSRTFRRVYGYSATWLDYYAGYYYDPAVQGELYWQYSNEVPLSQGYTEGYADWIPAEVWTVTAQYRPVTTYTVYSNHFVRAYYYYSTCSSYGFAGGCYSDPYGFSSFAGGTYGGYPGYGFNPYYYVSSRRYYLGTTSISGRTPSDQCAGGMAFDEVGNACTDPPIVAPTPQEPDTIQVIVSNTNLQPTGTGGTNTANVEVRTTPANRAVRLRLEATAEPQWSTDFGGHIESQHTGARPRGRLSTESGTTDASGVFRTTFTAPIFNGATRIVAQSGSLSVGQNVFIQVNGLTELGAGDNYRLIGCDNTPWHPCGTNHWGTPAANTGLGNIADDYKREYYGFGELTDDEKLAYNDQSLPKGGKFDIHHNWSEANIDHAEHRVGINCDVRSSNVPRDRWTKLNEIFENNGSTDTNDETGTRSPHWHLRFLFGAQQARAAMTAATVVPENWWGTMDHGPTEDDWAYWTNRITDAQTQGQAQTLSALKALNRSLFYSDEYVGFAKSDADFLTDCYVTYLRREPDQSGFNFWLGVMRDDAANGINPREHMIRAFEESIEFGEVASGLEVMSSPPADVRFCDSGEEQSCYNQGGSWDSSSCSCFYPEPEPVDPCYSGGYYMCE